MFSFWYTISELIIRIGMLTNDRIHIYFLHELTYAQHTYFLVKIYFLSKQMNFWVRKISSQKRRKSQFTDELKHINESQ